MTEDQWAELARELVKAIPSRVGTWGLTLAGEVDGDPASGRMPRARTISPARRVSKRPSAPDETDAE